MTCAGRAKVARAESSEFRVQSSGRKGRNVVQARERGPLLLNSKLCTLNSPARYGV
ncbi:MAG: hypothetical protein AVDCRST_MAG64-1957 [uncultured Phycisphaerae bacterium]|uniref:Uncharacterized protein n=1 Tax=uncultured Phycisphaerae bacterium TaxID=904963 RepID=A0A6J4P7A1_9BACT|nr:MAG: hypothetical protein AVDCRST_MAG64-1957 [uncultured Phycisphaerae bacterium]